MVVELMIDTEGGGQRAGIVSCGMCGSKGVVECGSRGVLECGSKGVVEYGSRGVLECGRRRTGIRGQAAGGRGQRTEVRGQAEVCHSVPFCSAMDDRRMPEGGRRREG